jgi:hypothetical protein
MRSSRGRSTGVHDQPRHGAEQEGRLAVSQQTSSHSGTAVGFTVFASVMMVMIGIFQTLAGVVALVNDEFFVVGQEYVFAFDATTWGWVHLLLGILIGTAGAFLFTGAVWARTVGVVVAVISAIVNFVWLPWYPIWAVIMITVDVFVIWALTLHGRDIAEA